jgi:hypothetical protein
MKSIKPLVCCVVFFIIHFTYSQVNSSTSRKRSLVKSSWIIGLGTNFVDDGGDATRNLFLLESQWNYLPYPSRISFGKYFESGFGLEIIGLTNKYKVSALMQQTNLDKDIFHYSLDTRISYDLIRLFGDISWFDPYVGVGLGYTRANEIDHGSMNIVSGLRLWIFPSWGIDFNSTAKWGMTNRTANSLQHSLGVVYQFGLRRTFRSNKK